MAMALESVEGRAIASSSVASATPTADCDSQAGRAVGGGQPQTPEIQKHPKM